MIENSLGDEPAILTGTGRRPPDRRQVSFRWLSGTFLTGITSAMLMGGALYAALDGRQQLAEPPQAFEQDVEVAAENLKVEKGDRPVAIVATKPPDQKVMLVPTVTKVGDSDVIRKRPFTHASAPLAIAVGKKLDFPSFNALAVFSTSSDDTEIAATSDLIYGADIDSEVTVKVHEFPLHAGNYDKISEPSDDAAEAIVRQIAPSLDDGSVRVAALPYFDDSRFNLEPQSDALLTSPGITITAQNVSVITKIEPHSYTGRDFAEEVIVIAKRRKLTKVLSELGADTDSAKVIADALEGELGSKTIKPGYRLRVAYERPEHGDHKMIRRASIYNDGVHIKSIARSGGGSIVYAAEPDLIPAVAPSSQSKAVRLVGGAQLPSVYKGIYRAALSQGLNLAHGRRLIKIFAFDVDFQKRIAAEDNLEVFYSLEEGEKDATEASEILYASINLNKVKRRYYRFRTPDNGVVDYYDEFGKSAKKFLLRKPVPNGNFRSPFGMRRHPISRRVKLHSGVDWKADRGTPIIAAGNGVVEKAGWFSGYGKQTIVRHANGYKTSYSHQHSFARGIRPGARVRQGQVIGRVGSTGYSTGPHLHYEVIVNGNKVDPMRIRLPQGRVLKSGMLAAFERERDRINALLEKDGDGSPATRVALNN